MTLDQRYEGHRVSFRYPGHWELAEDIGDETVTITVSDAGGAFWSLTILSRRPPLQHVLNQAANAFRDEYDEVDVYPVTTGNDQSAAGLTIEFVSLELINCAILRGVRTGAFTLLSMAQVTDQERAEYEPIFDEIWASVLFDPQEEMELA